MGLHITGFPRGGALGVDVFFVVSGYLITAGLLRQHALTGRISLRDFYTRRVRRIFPVAIVVLVVTVVVSLLILGPGLVRDIVPSSAVASLLFVENWRLAFSGVQLGPLNHYWSLSVEEQFYLVWPLLLIGLLAMGVALANRRRLGSPAEGPQRNLPLMTVRVALVLIIVASFAWAAIQPAESWSSYHSTLSRAWELAIGAFIATLPVLRFGVRFRVLLVGAALLVILAAVLMLSGPSVYPGHPLAALPVLAAGVVVYAGAGTTESAKRTLLDRAIGLPPVQYVGAISYSLYLWGWPIALLTIVLWDRSAVTVALGLILTFALSALSYHFVEQRFRVKPRPITVTAHGLVPSGGKVVGDSTPKSPDLRDEQANVR